jgi:hypothetical protein
MQDTSRIFTILSTTISREARDLPDKQRGLNAHDQAASTTIDPPRIQYSLPYSLPFATYLSGENRENVQLPAVGSLSMIKTLAIFCVFYFSIYDLRVPRANLLTVWPNLSLLYSSTIIECLSPLCALLLCQTQAPSSSRAGWGDSEGGHKPLLGGQTSRCCRAAVQFLP